MLAITKTAGLSGICGMEVTVGSLQQNAGFLPIM